MKILPEPVAFEWDKGNIDKNRIRHKVEVKEAEEIFENDPKFLFSDDRHSIQEKRYGIYGRTDNKRKLSIVFTIRNGKVRVITARDMSKIERRIYEEKIKEYSII